MNRILLGLILTAAAGVPSAFAQGNIDTGQRSFIGKCVACHRVGPDAKNAVGPQLNGVVGRKAGTVAGYEYSDANKKSAVTWDEPTLVKYLKAPQSVVPGTKMTYAGNANEQDVLDLIAYLKSFDASGKQTK
ncbi:MAG: cytochrome c family protein [Bauldia sp.]